jgi:hypothetical protein
VRLDAVTLVVLLTTTTCYQVQDEVSQGWPPNQIRTLPQPRGFHLGAVSRLMFFACRMGPCTGRGGPRDRSASYSQTRDSWNDHRGTCHNNSMYATRTDDVARKDDVTRIDDVPVQYSVRKRNRADVKNKNGTLAILLDAIPINVLPIADQNSPELLPQNYFWGIFKIASIGKSYEFRRLNI